MTVLAALNWLLITEEVNVASTITVNFRRLRDTGAALGKAGDHTIIVDRPPGRAGGSGLGFNGGQLLAFAIGGCLCNDLQYEAHEMDLAIDTLTVSVSLDLDGHLATFSSASVRVSCTLMDGHDSTTLIERAMAKSTVSNSIMQGFPVRLEQVA